MNIIRIPCTNEIDLFSYWVLFLKPIHHLTNREGELLGILLHNYMNMKKEVLSKKLLFELLLSEKERKKICEQLHITSTNLQVLLTNLRKKRILINNEIDNRLIPQIINDDPKNNKYPNNNNIKEIKLIISFDLISKQHK